MTMFINMLLGAIKAFKKQTGLITTIQITQNDSISNPEEIIKLVDSRDAIDWIRNNSHCYVAQDGSTGTNLVVKQLSDNTRNLYSDGTDASSDIKSKDVFMKLPQFWWTCNETTEGSNIWNISFSNTKKDGWFEWEGDTFIGVYKAHNDSNGIPQSISGTSMTVNVSQSAFKTGCANKGANYHIVTYEAHQIMCLLFYAYYLNTNSQAICGSGYNSSYITGSSDDMGMNDTPASGKAFVNFWGLEQWWGAKYEWMDNIITLGEGKVGIKDPGTASDTSDIKRTIQGIGQHALVKSFVFGEYGDVVAKTIYSVSNFNLYFADDSSINTSAGIIPIRSGYESKAEGGLSYLYFDFRSNNTYSIVGARLLYKGSYQIVQ